MNKKKHPKSLYILSFTEVWERYGFYTIQALLLLFLLNHFGINSSKAYIITGTFTAISYISPLIGGYIADKFIGQRLAVFIGIFFLSISYIIFSISINNIHNIYIALSGVALGTGLLKPNIACLVGGLYKSEDKHRDTGFSIYYAIMAFGITLGSFLPGWLKTYTNNWSIPFAFATTSILIASISFMIATFVFKIRDVNKINIKISNLIKTVLICIILWIVFYLFFIISSFAFIVFLCLIIFSFSSLVFFAFKEQGRQRKRIFVILFLSIISVVYWMLYFQMFLSLVVFISYCVNPKFFGLNFQEAYYIAIQSIGLIILGPILGILFKRFHHSIVSVDSSIKFALAMLTITICFCLLYAIVKLSQSTMLIAPISILFIYILVSVSEILLSPVGLSMITKLSPPKIVSYMMGIFYATLGIGGYLGGLLAQKFTHIPKKISDNSENTVSHEQLIALKNLFSTAFLSYALIAFITTILSFILVFFLRKWMALTKENKS